MYWLRVCSKQELLLTYDDDYYYYYLPAAPNSFRWLVAATSVLFLTAHSANLDRQVSLFWRLWERSV